MGAGPRGSEIPHPTRKAPSSDVVPPLRWPPAPPGLQRRERTAVDIIRVDYSPKIPLGSPRRFRIGRWSVRPRHRLPATRNAAGGEIGWRLRDRTEPGKQCGGIHRRPSAIRSGGEERKRFRDRRRGGWGPTHISAEIRRYGPAYGLPPEDRAKLNGRIVRALLNYSVNAQASPR